MRRKNIISFRVLRRGFVAAGAFYFIISRVSHGGTFYVKSNGSDVFSGATWAQAKRSITNAMTASLAGDQIWVASGVYTQLVTMKAGVALYGGFSGTETALSQRNWSTNLCWIHGNYKGSVVTIPSGCGPDTRVDGMAITGGAFTSAFGGGIACSGAGPVVANNLIFGNTAANSIGGGIYLNFYQNVPPVAQPIVTNNIIYQNTALGSIGEAAGICVRNSSPLIAWNKILFNVAGDQGGGIACFGNCQPMIANNIIEANASSADSIGLGGGILATANDYDGQPVFFAVSSPIIINNVVAANGADSGGGLALVDVPPAAGAGGALLVNNTIVANSGSGIFFANASPTNYNNLIAFNSAGLERSDSSSIVFKNNDIYGNNVLSQNTDFVGIPSALGINNNISADPGMANSRIGDFRLQPGSPCIDAGLTAAVVAGWPDRSGSNRVVGAAVDIGAYESSGTVLNSPTAIIHVSPTGSDANDGLTWATAKRTVQAGINAAAPGVMLGGEVWVARGMYSQHVTIPAFVYLYGGFAGSEPSRNGRNPSANPTILDGAGQPRVVQSLSAGYLVSTLDGFIVQNGGIYTGGLNFAGSPELQGGGINCQMSAPIIANNVIRSNSVGTPFNSNGTSKGGGINLYVSHALISSNTIAQNDVLDHTAGSGGGIYLLRSRPTITRNALYANHAVYGSAISADLLSSIRLTGNSIQGNYFYDNAPPIYYGAYDGAVLLTGCNGFLIEANTISGNRAGVGAGLDLKGPGAGIIRNNVIYQNQAYSADSSSGMGGGIYYEGDDLGSVSFINNTIFGNIAPSPVLGDMGGGIALNLFTNTTALVNNIIVSNSGGIWLRGGPAPATNLNNCVANPINYAGLAPIGPGVGDIHEDPGFTNAAGGDFHLVASSPCIDAGTSLSAPLTDRDGTPRPLIGKNSGAPAFDIGAYEFVNPLADTDHDGMPDWAELIAGTDPTNPNSTLQLQSKALSGNMLLNWKSVSGRIYSIDYSSALLPKNWQTLTNNVQGTGGVLEALDSLELASSRFYRVRVSQ
jgi:hypothetical protein